MTNKGTMRSRFRFFVMIGAIWLALAAFLVVQSWPDLPRSRLYWILFAAFVPPAYMLSETFSGWLFSRRHGEAISSKAFAIKRVLVAVPVVAVVVAIGLLKA